MNQFCLEVSGDFACFTRPEMKVERVSYDLITPSAARAVFESILWKPAIRWHVRRIEVLKPVRWTSVRRNEVGAVVSTRNVTTAMNAGRGQLALYVEDERQQRAGLILRDVAYRLHAELEFLSERAPHDNAAKYAEMFRRRASKGQCVNQPYLGCREFAARFRLVEAEDTDPPPIAEVDGDLGWMLHDMDYSKPTDPRPTFFRAHVKHGVLDLNGIEVRG
ncbi:MAG TPA: type I-C CRISPR-associated protein Cas5c [Denitromonas sp.]|uniref:type I-C CRISPR-associated protein Cas5c n=1 Tax=Denitromonas sp. TaxID=2734609 RepID=UPI001DE86122|nr:type I-C CRISPR-associated protein Cas5 [Rhodocyclaceae bacterium]MCP5222298.1 type I-C CRISPR-associated protein Cas5 [Zoogloeaceae bacterium]HPR05555.1 type I-C CRISPR-associated protein Cas5c [Denitromonas sp.]HQV14576.1 type I-C CRISPR-associated protein Cas5c [Denitromonas sp.]